MLSRFATYSTLSSRCLRSASFRTGSDAWNAAATARYKSTAVLSTPEELTSQQQQKQQTAEKKELAPIPDFNNNRTAFDSKTTGELMRAALVFRLCGLLPVQYADPLLKWSRRLLGDYLTDASLKATLYGHFCAGENEVKIQPAVEALRKNGIGSILDYAAESDIDPEDKPQKDTLLTEPVSPDFNQPAREYSYESEEACDHHVDVFKSCIRSVANVTPDGFAAVKMTALGNPILLERMSMAIVETKNLFAKFDSDNDGVINREEFETGYRLFFDESGLPDILETLDPEDTGKIDYITWAKLLSPRDLPAITKACLDVGPLGQATPTEKEVVLIENMHKRAHALAEEAAKVGTRLLIDAEQLRFQPAIDNLTLDLQQTYNAADVTDFPVIFNTYQCYLKDSLDRIKTDVERAERFGYHFACKLVRGAYMESERDLATKMLYPSPIHDTIEETHKNYNDAVAFLLRHQAETGKKLEVMCATHNQESIEKAIEVMNECGVDRSDKVLHFAQLYGMSDNLTYNLGKHGFHAYKYVPYGEVKEVMPYLVRRAQENSAMMGNASREVSLLKKELLRRARASVGFASAK